MSCVCLRLRVRARFSGFEREDVERCRADLLEPCFRYMPLPWVLRGKAYLLLCLLVAKTRLYLVVEGAVCCFWKHGLGLHCKRKQSVFKAKSGGKPECCGSWIHCLLSCSARRIECETRHGSSILVGGIAECARFNRSVGVFLRYNGLPKGLGLCGSFHGCCPNYLLRVVHLGWLVCRSVSCRISANSRMLQRVQYFMGAGR